MKTLSFALLLMVSMASVLMGCSDKSSPVVSSTEQAINSPSGSLSLGKMSRIAFTATEYAIGFVDGKYVGRGNRIVDKGALFTSAWVTTEPLLGNTAVYTFNASFNALGEGPMQGKFTMDADGGTWVGTVEGKMFVSSDGSELQGTFKYVAQGKGGSIDGMQLSCSEIYHEALDHYSYAYGDLNGYIQTH
jgi:hypothetical protein